MTIESADNSYTNETNAYIAYIKLTDNANKLADNRDNTIEVTQINIADKVDMFLHIHSLQNNERSHPWRIK